MALSGRKAICIDHTSSFIDCFGLEILTSVTDLEHTVRCSLHIHSSEGPVANQTARSSSENYQWNRVTKMEEPDKLPHLFGCRINYVERKTCQKDKCGLEALILEYCNMN